MLFSQKFGIVLAPILQWSEQTYCILLFVPLSIQPAENPQQRDKNNNHHYHHNEKDVQLTGFLLKHCCTRLKLSVLSCLFLHVEIDIAVVVAHRLVVDG